MNSAAKHSPRLIAIDPSLRSTGWVLFSIEESLPLAVGLLSAPGTHLPLPRRLEQLQKDVTCLFHGLQLCSNDYAVCEGPAPLVLNPNTAMIVEQVRGMFETVGRACDVCIPGRINPRSIHVELLGASGKQLERQQIKAIAREIALKLYRCHLQQILSSEQDLSHLSQDIIDALLVGTLAVSRIKMALRANLDLVQTFSSSSTKGRSANGRKTRSGWESYVDSRRTR